MIYLALDLEQYVLEEKLYYFTELKPRKNLIQKSCVISLIQKKCNKLSASDWQKLHLLYIEGQFHAINL